MNARRVVVRLEPAPRGRAAIETAVDLAARLEAELVGLFVEDVTLLQWAALPFAREIGMASVTSRRRDVASIERSLRSLAEQAHDTLAQVAGRAPLRWSFQVARGPVLCELLAAAEHADLLVSRSTGLQRLPVQGPGRNGVADTPFLLLQNGPGSAVSTVMVCTAITPAGKAAAILGSLAECGYGRLEVLLACEQARLAREWEGAVRAGLAPVSLQKRVRIRAVSPAELARLLEQADRSSA
jgi:nucleotide-binding universal stress UspA family protein